MLTQSLFAELAEDVTPISVEDGNVTLRPYQVEAVDGVYEQWRLGAVATLVTLPTGTGKSVVFSEVMRRWNGGRMLVLAHRSELIYQAVHHAETAGLTAGVEMAFERSNRSDDVVVSSIQTQTAWSKCGDCGGHGCLCEIDVEFHECGSRCKTCKEARDQHECDNPCAYCHGAGKVRRMTRFRPQDFGLLVIDEAHHAAAKTYRVTLEYYRQNPALKVLLVTATPKRSDNIGLHNVCDSVAYEMDLRHAIGDGWLCPIRQRFIEVESLRLGDVKTKAGGDLADGDLERAWLDGTDDELLARLHEVVRPTLAEAKGRPTLVFAAGVEHAKLLTAAFNAYDESTAELVVQDTPKAERRQIVERYKRGATQVLVNVGCFTEGFDAPGTVIVANARPTKSESLYLQMIGRGTRPLAGVVDGPETAAERRAAIAASDKPHCIVLDFVGDSGRHKLVSVGSVLAGDDVQPIDLEEAMIAARKADEAVDIEELVEKAKQAREEREKRLEEERKQRIATRKRADECEYNATDVDLFGGKGFDAFEDYTPKPGGATQKQVAYLVKLGVSPETAMTYSKRQAGAVIDSKTKAEGPDYVMRFGKYAGKRLRDIPKGYRSWMRMNLKNGEVLKHLRAMG